MNVTSFCHLVNNVNNKCTNGICERELFPDDCDCGFDKELLL